MEAIILAGGPGTRLRSIVPDVPKPMAPIGGRPFLEYLLRYWEGQGVSRCVLAVGYKGDCIRDHFGGRFGSLEIEYAVEESLLGTGGGLLNATGFLKSRGPFLILNADTYYEVGLADLCRFHDERGADLTMAVFRRGVNDRYGAVQITGDGRIKLFLNRHAAGQAGGLINGGVYLSAPQIWRGFRAPGALEKVSLETDLFPALLQQNARLYAFEAEGTFVDIGVPEDYQQAQRLLGGPGPQS